MGVQACRLPGLKPLKPFQRFKIFLARPTPQATGTPRPDQWLPFAILSTLTTLQNLLGTPSRAGNRHPKARSMASHGRSSLPLATSKRLKIFLARLTPQATGTPRPDQWLLMGVQACRLPAFYRLKPFKRLNILLACQPRRQQAPHGHINGFFNATKMSMDKVAHKRRLRGTCTCYRPPH